MANTLKHKQSSVAGKVPTTTDLALGELAINTTDGKVYLKKNVSGTESVVEVAPVTSVAGKTGAVTLVKGDVGLSNVDNTADASKPISTATQTALDAKQPLDADLTAIAALSGTTGLLKKTAANTWALDTSTYLTSAVTSVGGTGTVSGLSLSGTVTNSGNLTLGGTLAVTPSNFASQTANQFLAAPNGAAGVPTFRAIVAADIPTLNQNTTGSSGSCTGNAASASSVPWSGVTSKPTTLAGYGITDGGNGFPTGTAMLFVQTSAPTGWTKSITHNDKTLRVVNGTASSGGTSAFSTVFASRTPTGSVSSSFFSGSAASTTATGTIAVSGGAVSATTLDSTMIPSHGHSITATRFTSSTTHSHSGMGGTLAEGPSGGAAANASSAAATGGGLSHTHAFTNPTASFTGTAHTHTVSGSVSSSFSGSAMDFAVQYVDVIIATKD